MDMTQLFGLAGAVVVLAGLTVVIVNGGNTAKVIGSTASGFADVIRAATGAPAPKK